MNWTQARFILANRERYDRKKHDEAALTTWRGLPWQVRAMMYLRHLSPGLAEKVCVWLNARPRTRE